MPIDVTKTDQACGAYVRRIDLTKPVPTADVDAIRRAWLEHHVLAFPDQPMSDDDLERFTLRFGPFGADPFIAPLPGREHVIAVARAADEKASIFAEAWHTDWSFQEHPPAGTCLFGITVPPVGGDTLFVNQHLALAEMPDELRAKIEGKNAIHSAKVAYGPDGIYGKGDSDAKREMQILYSSDAEQTQAHPLIRRHPESGLEALFGCAGYICGIEGLEHDEAWALLMELYQWQTRPEFQYRHVWEANMLLMWDNRSVLHMATGGYDGYERLLHRTTIGAVVPN